MLIRAAALPGGQFRFDLPTEPGYTYRIEFTDDLSGPTGWTTLFTTNASTALLSFMNEPGVRGGGGFYRASHD
jgi:hypothetical protein